MSHAPNNTPSAAAKTLREGRQPFEWSSPTPWSASDQETLRGALAHFGEPAQRTKLTEECGELIAALARFALGQCDESDVIDELVDVQIVAAQLELALGPSRVGRARAAKLARLRERMGER